MPDVGHRGTTLADEDPGRPDAEVAPAVHVGRDDGDGGGVRRRGHDRGRDADGGGAGGQHSGGGQPGSGRSRRTQPRRRPMTHRYAPITESTHWTPDRAGWFTRVRNSAVSDGSFRDRPRGGYSRYDARIKVERERWPGRLAANAVRTADPSRTPAAAGGRAGGASPPGAPAAPPARRGGAGGSPAPPAPPSRRAPSLSTNRAPR